MDPRIQKQPATFVSRATYHLCVDESVKRIVQRQISRISIDGHTIVYLSTLYAAAAALDLEYGSMLGTHEMVKIQI